MAEDKNKKLPNAENESLKAASDEAKTEIADAAAKQLDDKETESILSQKAPIPSSDDDLDEIKEALAKAEQSDASDSIADDKAAKLTDDRFERITEDDFKLPEDFRADDERTQLADEPSADEKLADMKTERVPQKPVITRKTVTADSYAEPRTAPEGNAAKSAKKHSPAKIAILILILVIVAAGAFALVHFVITPNIASSGGDQNDTSQTSDDDLDAASPTESPYAQKVDEQMQKMSRREKICQLLMVTPERMTGEDLVTQAGDLTKDTLSSYPVGGVIYSQQNFIGDDQAKQLIADTQSYSDIPLFIAVDDDAIISPSSYSSLSYTVQNEGSDHSSADWPYDEAVSEAKQKRDLGFNLDLSLDADASDLKENNSEMTDAEANTLLSSAIKGYNEGGMIPSLKFFPCKADIATTGTTAGEDGFIHTARTADDFNASSEFTAFRSGIESGTGMIMVDHIVADEIDAEKPATLSAKVTPDLLRDQLNYQGVTITGNMAADNVTTAYSYTTIVKGIFDSDIDVILNPNSIISYVSEIEKQLESGAITEEQLNAKVKRILTLKYEKGIISDSNGSADATRSTESNDATQSTDSTETNGSTDASEAAQVNETTEATELTDETVVQYQ